jgi:hypothetical protein
MRVERGRRGVLVRSTANQTGGADERAEGKRQAVAISKWVVWEAHQRVKANDGAGVDEQSIKEFERDLKGTCTSSGIGSRQGAISLRQCGQSKYRKQTGKGVRVLGVPRGSAPRGRQPPLVRGS